MIALDRIPNDPEHPSRFFQSPIATDFLSPKFARKRPLAFWGVVCSALTSANFILASKTTDQLNYFIFCEFLIIGLFSVTISFRICANKFLKWKDNAHRFFYDSNKQSPTDLVLEITDDLSFFHLNRWMAIFSVMFGATACVVYLEGGYFLDFDDMPGKFAIFLAFASASMAGLGLAAIAGASRMIWRLGRFNVRVENHNFGILSSGKMLLECYFLICLCWSFYVCTAYFGLESNSDSKKLTQVIDDMKYPLLLIAAPTSVALILSFFISQIPLHQKMRDYKFSEIKKIETLLLHHRKNLDEKVDSKTREMIEFLERQQQRVLQLPEWPFGRGGFWGVFSTPIAVITPTVLSSLIVEAVKAAV